MRAIEAVRRGVALVRGEEVRWSSTEETTTPTNAYLVAIGALPEKTKVVSVHSVTPAPRQLILTALQYACDSESVVDLRLRNERALYQRCRIDRINETSGAVEYTILTNTSIGSSANLDDIVQVIFSEPPSDYEVYLHGY